MGWSMAVRRGFRASAATALLVLAASFACSSSPPGQSATAGVAVTAPKPGWKVLHCGTSRGVLYLTYAEKGVAGITPALDTAAVREACAAAGYPVGVGAAERPLHVVPDPRTQGVTAAEPAPPRARTAVPPSFTTHASGSAIAIDGRNDGDTAYRCVLNFSWTFDDDPTGPRAVTTQATLPGRQVNRVVFISGSYRNARFVGLPTWHCIAAD